jgi:quinoprotein glucose dehydrogenase
VKPPPLVPLATTPDDAFGFTPWDRGRCREKLEAMRNEGVYTPIGLDWTLLLPAPTGGVNWGGLAVDPERQLLVVNTVSLVGRQRLVPRAEFDAARARGDATDDDAPQLGTPYGVQREMVMSPFGAPCNAPPWGRLTAIDLTSGEPRWERPLGSTWDLGLPLDYELGLPNFGGPLVTKSGLVFIGAATGSAFRAFDLASGEELWRTRLPAGASATPMSYRVEDPEGGSRQLVVVAAGGHWGFHTESGADLGDALVAFALPRE